MKLRWPVITLFVASAAMIVAASPALQAALVYDRQAILHGELWRLFTGHWVHFSTKHLLYDTGVFTIAGWTIEKRGHKNFGWLCLLSPLLIGVSLLLFAPNLALFGGLSGIATAAVTYSALAGLNEDRRWKHIGVVVLCLIAVKITFEFVSGGFVFIEFGDSRINSVPLNHLTGALTACFIYFAMKPTVRGLVRSDQVSSTDFSPAGLTK